MLVTISNPTIGVDASINPYLIGVHYIDDAHLELLALMDILAKLESKEDVISCLQGLRVIWKVDCETEEAYMIGWAFPYLESHKKAHEAITNLIEISIKILRDSDFPYSRGKSKLLGDLLVLLIDHLDVDDMKLRGYFKQSNLSH